MIWVYRILFLPAVICSLPYHLWRMWRRGGYRHDFHHRFGLVDRPPPKAPGVKRLWIQAVSVGEAQALGPLLARLREQPNLEIILTTTTSTAYQIIREKYARDVLKVGIFPLDFWPFSRSAWRRLEPDLAVLMEGELWPEHLHQARARGVPVALINARMSNRSFERYQQASGVARWILRQVQLVLCATPSDHERFVALGADPAHTILTGSLKLDVKVGPALTAAERAALREELGFGVETTIQDSKFKIQNPAAQSPMPLRNPGDALKGESTVQDSKFQLPTSNFSSPLPAHGSPLPLVLLGSSTWPGEEAVLLEALNEALAAGLDARLLLVPRHAERRRELIAWLEKQPLPFHVRSQSAQAPQPVKIYLGDTTGELARLSQAADLAFIGKSLPPHDGGQTPIEAAALGLPLIFGPRMSNFKDIARQLVETGAARRVQDVADAKANLLGLLHDPASRVRMGHAGRTWHAASQGATGRTAAALRELLTKWDGASIS